MSGPPTILISGFYGWGNAGDEAILAGMLAALRARRPGLRFVVASGDPARTTDDHQVRAIARNDLAALVEAVRSSDLVLLGGGGLFQDYYPTSAAELLAPMSGGLAMYVSTVLLAAALGRPCMLYAVGVGPLQTAYGRELTRASFELCDAASVRDRQSLAMLASLDLEAPALARVQLAADPAFAVTPLASAPLDQLWRDLGLGPDEKPLAIALRDSPFPPAEGETVPPPAWEREVSLALAETLSASDGRLLFLAFHPERDVAVHRRVIAGLPHRERIVVVEDALEPAELAGLLARCRAVLAMRCHAALLAVAAGTPVVALDYDPKVGAVMEAVGCGDLALPPARWRSTEVLAALARTRAPAAEPVAALRRRAADDAALALTLLDAAPPRLTAGERLLRDVAVDKALLVAALAPAAAEAARERDLLAQRLRSLREECDAAYADRDRAMDYRDRAVANSEWAVAERDLALADRDRAVANCTCALEERDRVLADRDLALADRDRAVANCTWALEERDRALADRTRSSVERDDALARLQAFEATRIYALASRYWRLVRRLSAPSRERQER